MKRYHFHDTFGTEFNCTVFDPQDDFYQKWQDPNLADWTMFQIDGDKDIHFMFGLLQFCTPIEDSTDDKNVKSDDVIATKKNESVQSAVPERRPVIEPLPKPVDVDEELANDRYADTDEDEEASELLDYDEKQPHLTLADIMPEPEPFSLQPYIDGEKSDVDLPLELMQQVYDARAKIAAEYEAEERARYEARIAAEQPSHFAKVLATVVSLIVVLSVVIGFFSIAGAITFFFPLMGGAFTAMQAVAQGTPVAAAAGGGE